MGGTKIVSLFIVLLSLFLLWLNWNGKLVPVIEDFVAPAPTGPSLGEYTLGFVTYLVALSFLSDDNGFKLTLILVISALGLNIKNQGQDAVIPLLFGTGKKQ